MAGVFDDEDEAREDEWCCRRRLPDLRVHVVVGDRSNAKPQLARSTRASCSAAEALCECTRRYTVRTLNLKAFRVRTEALSRRITV
jgi:hypothetical protein